MASQGQGGDRALEAAQVQQGGAQCMEVVVDAASALHASGEMNGSAAAPVDAGTSDMRVDMNLNVDATTAARMAMKRALAEEGKDDGEDAAMEAGASDQEDEEDEHEPEPVESEMEPLAKHAPVSDFDVAATYAELEIRSMASQLEATVVDVTKPPTVSVPACGDGAAKALDQVDREESETEEEEDEAVATLPGSSSSDEDSSDDEELETVRAEIEAATEREATTATGLKTANEVDDVPVRKPEVEITPTTPIARCGTILSLNQNSLMATVTSDSDLGMNPLDEGTVLCLQDRTVLGCVDEVFGPVLMPMYLVRFESLEKIPSQAKVGHSVFFVTENTTYIVPDKLRGKGTDASNIYDEEADDVVYSDDEEEAAAKRQHRKRNRFDSAPAQINVQPESRSRSTSGGFFMDFHSVPTGRQRSGSGTGRAYMRGHGRNQGHHNPGIYQHVQSQAHGGITRYTSGYAQAPAQGYGPNPGMGNYAGPPPPMPPVPFSGMYGSAFMPGALGPQYGYPPQFAQAPPAYYQPPLPPAGADTRPPPNGYYDPSVPQFGQQFPSRSSSGTYDYGR